MSPGLAADTTVALVTGANRGIGLEIARQLADHKITVLLACRDEQRGRQAAGQLRTPQRHIRHLHVDVTAAATLQEAAAEIIRSFGKLDILVNNAGIRLDDAPPAQLRPELLRQTYETNRSGCLRPPRPCCQRCDGRPLAGSATCQAGSHHSPRRAIRTLPATCRTGPPTTPLRPP
jgi:NAD(P)-dependent dehydrogenase (short-subunit alcohol dehydrogenase family)